MFMHRHRPKWKDRPPPWPPHIAGESWTAEEWAARRQTFRRRFAVWFGLIALAAVGLLVGLIILVVMAGRLGIGSSEALIVLCLTVPVALLILFSIGMVAFRRLGSPLADLMAAADAVADGDLSVRVPEGGRGDMARLTARFNRMTAELERAEQSRRNLTADVAHELRTPLHIIQGNLEGVLDGVYEPTREHVAALLDETRVLSRLVEDLQTLSLAEAGQLPLHRRLVPAVDLLEDAATRFVGAAADAGVMLKVLPGDASLVVDVDADRLDQALSNLVANALRHTPAGGRITLAARSADDGVVLEVADTGTGIDAADLPFVFDRFWRGDRARGRHGGAGLGLPIARRLVEAHGGAIEAKSEPGAGTTFTIWLPAPENRVFSSKLGF